MSQRDDDYKPQNTIALKSPLAIGGYFIHFLQRRFLAYNLLPWAWTDDDLTTGIFITSGGVIETELRNNRPAIYVTIGELRGGPVVIGNRAANEFLIEKKYNYSRIDLNVAINCESPNSGEAFAIGWIVFSSVMAAQEVIRDKYQISNIGPFGLVPPRPSNKERETYVSTVNVGLTYEFTFNVEAVQTFIKEIDVSLDINANNDPTGFLTRLYVGSVEESI